MTAITDGNSIYPAYIYTEADTIAEIVHPKVSGGLKRGETERDQAFILHFRGARTMAPGRQRRCRLRSERYRNDLPRALICTDSDD